MAKGTFHKFCDEIQHCLIDVGVENYHEQDITNYQEMGDQRRYKQEKNKIMEEKGTKKAQKKLINAIYCYQMYLSFACVKDDPQSVT